MTDRPAPRLALTPDEAAALLQADELRLVGRILAMLVEATARRAAEMLADDGSRRDVEYLTVKDAAYRLGVHENTIRRAIKDGRLAAGRVGARGAWRIEADALDRLITASPATSAPRDVRLARQRRRRAAPTTSFSARARAQNQVQPRSQSRSTKEAT